MYFFLYKDKLKKLVIIILSWYFCSVNESKPHTHHRFRVYTSKNIFLFIFAYFSSKAAAFQSFLSLSFKHCHTHRARALAKRKSNVHVDAPAMPLRLNAFIPLQTHRFGVLRSVAAVPRGAGERTGARRWGPPANRDPFRSS